MLGLGTMPCALSPRRATRGVMPARSRTSRSNLSRNFSCRRGSTVAKRLSSARAAVQRRPTPRLAVVVMSLANVACSALGPIETRAVVGKPLGRQRSAAQARGDCLRQQQRAGKRRASGELGARDQHHEAAVEVRPEPVRGAAQLAGVDQDEHPLGRQRGDLRRYLARWAREPRLGGVEDVQQHAAAARQRALGVGSNVEVHGARVARLAVGGADVDATRPRCRHRPSRRDAGPPAPGRPGRTVARKCSPAAALGTPLPVSLGATTMLVTGRARSLSAMASAISSASVPDAASTASALPRPYSASSSALSSHSQSWT